MKKSQKNIKTIIAGILFLIGICFALFGKSVKIKGGLTCLFWGVAILVVTWITCEVNKAGLIQFNQEAQEILKDIATRGAESEYYLYYNHNIINSLRKKFIKRQRKQLIGITILGVVLIITGILCIA